MACVGACPESALLDSKESLLQSGAATETAGVDTERSAG